MPAVGSHTDQRLITDQHPTRLTLDKEEITTWGKNSANDVLIKASLSAKWENADAIDTAVTASTGLSKEHAIGAYTISRFIPFNPVDKKTIAYCTGPDGKKFVAAKGAPQVCLWL